MTKRFKHIYKLFLESASKLSRLVTLFFTVIFPGQLYANEPADKYFQITGVLLANGAIIIPREDDLGFDQGGKNTHYYSDDESLRLITTGNFTSSASWEVQYLNQRQASSLDSPSTTNNLNLFRYRSSRHYFIDGTEHSYVTTWHHELDRLFTKYEYDSYAAVVGRQAISWGSGRFWQPTDVFGAFSPIELNREYKPGIDAIKFDYFPTHASGLALAYVFGNRDIDNFEDSAALHYRTILGEDSEITLLAGKIFGVTTGGGSFETSWLEMGWRLESIFFKVPDRSENDSFTIAGIDYQFSNDVSFSLELYYNSLGETREDKLIISAALPTYINGQQKHLGQNVMGVSLTKTLTPLLTGNYNFLVSALEDVDGSTSWSSLHQVLLSYSIADESDALLAIHYGTGKGLDILGQPRSEFGHVPPSLSLRIRYYF